MHDFDNFNKRFNKNFRRTEIIATIWFVFVLLLSLATIGGIGYVIFRVLSFCGIM